MKLLIVINVILLLFSSCKLSKEKSTTIKITDCKIAYNIHLPDTTKDDWEIMIMDFDGNNKKNITNHPDVAWTYYAFKDQLYFISDRDTMYRNYFLYTMDSKGENIKKVTNLRLEDSWMSSRYNGSEMIVTGRTDKVRHQLFIVNLKDGSYNQLTSDTSARYGDPCFSPDGEQIVFSYKKNKRDRSSHEELYIMNDDGSDMKQLTHYPEDNISAKEYGYKAGACRWHPTDNFISYLSKQDGRHSIFAITPDGKKQWKLTENTLAEGWHDWSSDGEWLCYNGSDIEESQYHIYLMNWKTKVVKQLSDVTYKSQQAPLFICPEY